MSQVPDTEGRIRSQSHRSELGEWRHSLAVPAPDLAEDVEAIWEVRGRQAYARDRVLPHGRLELIVSLGPAQALDEGGRLRWFDGAFLSGLQGGALITECPGEVHLVGVTLRPIGAYRLLAESMASLADRVEPLEALHGHLAIELRGRLLGARSVAERVERVEKFLRERARRGRAARPEVAWLWWQIEKRGGRVRLESLRSELGWSRKKLVAEFRDQVGLAPKRVARIFRFQSLIRSIPESGPVDWAGLAFDCGYADQSHLIRDFGELGGLTPSRFLELRLPGGGVRAE
jgi:AraC-like DNA-binding protein